VIRAEYEFLRDVKIKTIHWDTFYYFNEEGSCSLMWIRCYGPQHQGQTPRRQENIISAKILLWVASQFRCTNNVEPSQSKGFFYLVHSRVPGLRECYQVPREFGDWLERMGCKN